MHAGRQVARRAATPTNLRASEASGGFCEAHQTRDLVFPGPAAGSYTGARIPAALLGSAPVGGRACSMGLALVPASVSAETSGFLTPRRACSDFCKITTLRATSHRLLDVVRGRICKMVPAPSCGDRHQRHTGSAQTKSC